MIKSFEEFTKDNNIDISNIFLDDNIYKLSKIYNEKIKLINMITRFRLNNQYKGCNNGKYEKEIKECNQMIELCDTLIEEYIKKIKIVDAIVEESNTK